MTPPAPPSQADVLQAIAGLFDAPRSAAALGHYPTLRIQTDNLHDALNAAIETVNTIVDEWAVELACDDHVVPDFRSTDSTVSSYRTIAPALACLIHRGG